MATVQVLGNGFGLQPSHVSQVTIGGKECPRVDWVSQTEIHVAIPPGVGANQEVRVSLSTGLSSSLDTSPTGQISYLQPEVVSISPEYIFATNVTGDFDISGAHFGNAASDLESIRVGG